MHRKKAGDLWKGSDYPPESPSDWWEDYFIWFVRTIASADLTWYLQCPRFYLQLKTDYAESSRTQNFYFLNLKVCRLKSVVTPYLT